MAQNRPPPAYQEYAASMLASNAFRMMDLSTRGLLYTLRLEYWIGNPLPADPVMLAKILRLDAAVVSSALVELGDLVLFNEGMINIPELDDYRQHLSGIRKKQSIGGKEGAQIARRNAANRKANIQSDAYPMVNHQVTQGSSRSSSAQSKTVKSSPEQPSPVINDGDDWVVDYEESEVHGYSGREAQKLNKFNRTQ